MILALVLIIMVLGSLVFHFVNPWHAPALASNWLEMDRTLDITFAVTGLFFVVLNLLLVWLLVRFKHKPGQRAAYQPENHRLERWLIGITALGIIGLLAPGLLVYADYVRPPANAMLVEVLGKQWQWRYRFPGADGKFGGSDARFMTASNPYGLDPADPNGQDDVLVEGSELHLPLNQPMKFLLRSADVLHDFYMPPMRARLNMVPGTVTSFWFTPTEAGRYEALCAQLCGIGHANMRGSVVVEALPQFQSWLGGQARFSQPAAAAAVADTPAARGEALAKAKACVACHSVDGSAGVGPTWKGLYGKTETLTDGSTHQVDAAFLRGEITDPQARVVKGFAPIMPKIELSSDEVNALVAYIESRGK